MPGKSHPSTRGRKERADESLPPWMPPLVTTRGPSATPHPHRVARLTEHGHELLGVEVPVAPVGPVAMQRGILLVVVGRFCPEGVDDPDAAPAPGDQGSVSSLQHLPGPGLPQPRAL